MSRTSLLASAFRDIPLTVGPHTLRPLTAGTMMLLMQTGNALFAGAGEDGEDAQEVDEAASMQALFEFIWIHCGPRAEVVRQCAQPERLREAARDFAMDISFEDLENFSLQFAQVRERMTAALVDVVAEPGEKKPQGETPPLTGSPLSSTPSAAPEIPGASGGSSGSSPSSELSNTSTPHTPTTEPGPAGRSPIWEAPQSMPEEEENVIPMP